ncbi:hypothetical protein F5Y03DRAFT_248541 [Xylaria venustula]|nr:hypothetical protein F5Y03DRAFT_248541 [Xylaria venustula]
MHPHSSSNPDTVDATNAMDRFGSAGSAYAPQDGAADPTHLAFTGSVSTPGTWDRAGSSHVAADINESQVDGSDESASRGNPSRGRGRGIGYLRARRGTARVAKRGRIHNHDGEEVDQTPTKQGKKRRRRRDPTPEPEPNPLDFRRPPKTSLRDRLLRGDYEPPAMGMRAYNLKKAATAAANAASAANALTLAALPRREFLVPVDPGHGVDMTPSQAPSTPANNIPSADNTSEVQPNPHIAYKSTPRHQLYFPESLALAIKQNAIKWAAKNHNPSVVFVVTRLVGSNIADMHVFTSLREATADALHMIVHEHPEAFAIAPDTDEHGNEIKPERSETAAAVIQEITARPAFKQVVGNADETESTTASEGDAHLSDEEESLFVREDEDGSGTEEGSLFVIKEEDGLELPRRSRFADARPDVNGRGELMLRDAPEPIYVFWGKYKIVSFGLKMEARRADGAAVKVSVHLKNLRKPANA